MTTEATPKGTGALSSSRFHWLFLTVCAALLLILVISSFIAGAFLNRMHGQEQDVRRTLTGRTQLLSGLWLSMQSYNQAVEQFVAKETQDGEKAARRQLDDLTLLIDSDLSRYPTLRDSEESALLAEMQAVFSRQRTLYISIIQAPPGENRQNRDEVAQRLAPLQKEILDWSKKLQTWNEGKLRAADESLVAQFTELQTGLTKALAIGLGSGLLLVLVAMAYIVRLERQTRDRYGELVRNRQELQRLTESLVDAQEAERRSISRELHDEIGQSLGALLVGLGRLSSAAHENSPEIKMQIDKMKSVAEGTLQSVRNIALLLRPSMLDDLGLATALEWQGREVSRRSDIEVDVQTGGVSDDLPDGYRVCVYRLVQEALNNAVRHSGAKNAKVTVEQSPQEIVVRVEDDGCGFNPARQRGLGILGMEERVKRLGGTFDLESGPGKGTILTAKLPSPEAGAVEAEPPGAKTPEPGAQSA